MAAPVIEKRAVADFVKKDAMRPANIAFWAVADSRKLPMGNTMREGAAHAVSGGNAHRDASAAYFACGSLMGPRD